MEKNLVINPTSTAQWHMLIQEAEKNCNITLHEDLESYLVFLLMRFATETDINQRIMAMELLEAHTQLPQKQKDTLRQIGDTCLLYSGLFPGQARRRRVRISYYIKLGQTAYQSLSELHKTLSASLYQELCQQFIPMMDILLSIRNTNPYTAALDPLQAEELYYDTGSMHALNTLNNIVEQPFFFQATLNTSKH